MTDNELPEGISRAEFNDLQGAVKDLAAALQAKNDAETATERQEAHEDVKDARADLDQVAKDLGIPVAKLRAAAENAKREEEKERLRPLLIELLDEVIATDEPATDEQPADEPATDDAASDEDAAAELDGEEIEDTAPTKAHWSEGTFSDLLGLRQ